MDGNHVSHTYNPVYYDQLNVPSCVFKKDVSSYQVKTDIYNCYACNASKLTKCITLKNFDAPVFVVSEKPDQINFFTKEGKLLADTFLWAGYKLDDIYFTSLVKCSESIEPEKCLKYLIRELLIVDPEIIIALGYNVAKHFDNAVRNPGHISLILDQYKMLSTHAMEYVISNAQNYEEFCQHLLYVKSNMFKKEMQYI